MAKILHIFHASMAYGSNTLNNILGIFVFHGPVDDVFIEGIQHSGIILNIPSLLPTTNLEGKFIEEALKSLPFLVEN
jgi:hypothetical protein